MVPMIQRHVAGLLLLPLSLSSAFGQTQTPVKFPDEIIVGKHTFVDFGPPNDFYEIYILRVSGQDTSVERLTVTPAGQACIQPPTVERAIAELDQSIPDLLQHKNPCLIPEKELTRERKRCKHCMVFSGADVNMQVKCGQATRTLRMDILDEDMFDPAAHTPVNTSQTMDLLSKLDKALGGGVLDRPMFDLSYKPSTKEHSEAIDQLRAGDFDNLFPSDPDKPSQLYTEAQRVYPAPTITLVSASPIAPISPKFPPYPPIARYAHIQGKVGFELTVSSSGTASGVKFLSGPKMLESFTELALSKWTFPQEADGKTIQGTIDFELNCPADLH